LTKPIRYLGLISDTHGLLRKKALGALRGSELILHAGDVGAPEILESLREIAPVVAVRGNVDAGALAEALPLTKAVEAGEVRIYMLHILQELDLDPGASGFSIVGSGHSHKPGESLKDGVLYVNPGSAGPKRFNLPVTAARLDLQVRPWRVEFVDIGGDE
jgi:putative phosphoesterase